MKVDEWNVPNITNDRGLEQAPSAVAGPLNSTDCQDAEDRTRCPSVPLLGIGRLTAGFAFRFAVETNVLLAQ